MTDNEILFQVRKLRRLVGEAKETQDKCNHNHHCHVANEKLSEAEWIAYDLQREIEIQQGEQLAKVTA